MVKNHCTYCTYQRKVWEIKGFYSALYVGVMSATTAEKNTTSLRGHVANKENDMQNVNDTYYSCSTDAHVCFYVNARTLLGKHFVHFFFLSS